MLSNDYVIGEEEDMRKVRKKGMQGGGEESTKRGEEGGWRRSTRKGRESIKNCAEKKRGEKEEFIRKVGRARTEGEIWEIIRKQRGGRKRVNEEIKEDFMNLMGGSENKVRGRKRKVVGVEMEDLEREEVELVLRGLKKGKAAGEDELVNEVWKYGGEG